LASRKTPAATHALKYDLCVRIVQLFSECRHPKLEDILLAFSAFLLQSPAFKPSDL
jgi:hypothetical protein